MKRKRISLLQMILVSSASILLFAACSGIPARTVTTSTEPAVPENEMHQAAAETSVSITLADGSISEGETIVLNVDIAQATDVYGYQYTVKYDASHLTLLSTDKGTFLSHGEPDSTFYVEPKTDTPGLVALTAETRLGGSGVNGNGTLGTLTFTVNDNSAALPTLQDVLLADSKANTIAVMTR